MDQLFLKTIENNVSQLCLARPSDSPVFAALSLAILVVNATLL